MTAQKRIWRLVVPIAILAMVMAMTLGMAWHHHANFASEQNCPICHLSHQAMAPPAASVAVCALAPAGAAPELPSIRFFRREAIRNIRARGPPA